MGLDHIRNEPRWDKHGPGGSYPRSDAGRRGVCVERERLNGEERLKLPTYTSGKSSTAQRGAGCEEASAALED